MAPRAGALRWTRNMTSGVSHVVVDARGVAHMNTAAPANAAPANETLARDAAAGATLWSVGHDSAPGCLSVDVPRATLTPNAATRLGAGLP